MTLALQQMIESVSLDSVITMESLQSLAPGTHCAHKSWGTGKIAEWHLAAGYIIVDFENKRGHSMQIQYAVQTLHPLCHDDLRVRVFQDALAVRSEAESLPVEFIRRLLQANEGRMVLEHLSSTLVPKVFDTASFKKWWDALRKKLKSDAHFHLPSKKTDPIEFRQIPLSSHKVLLAQFHTMRRLKDQIAIVDQIIKSIDGCTQDTEADMRAVMLQIEDTASKGRKLQSAQTIELLLARDEILSRYESSRFEAPSITIADILRAEETRLPVIFAALPYVKHRRVLSIFPEAFGENWKMKVLGLSQKVSWRTVADIARLLEANNVLHEFQKAIFVSIMERSVSQEILYWLCKERGSCFLRHLFNADLLSTMLIILEHDRLSDRKRHSRLHDLLVEDKTLLQDLLSNANQQAVRDIMRRLLLNSVFEDVDRRLLLARIIKIYPELQNMVCEKAESAQTAFTVSWASLERRKAEYDDLVNRKITQSVKDIAIARSYGDLRENLEFKSAKEQYAVLVRRKAELELMLDNARGTNFEAPDTSKVSIGTVVSLTEMISGHTETYTILGAWDGIPSQNIISYQTAIGRTLLGKQVGDVVEIHGSNGNLRQWHIDTIRPFENLEIL